MPVVSICGSMVGSRLWFCGVFRLLSSIEPSRPEESIAELIVESRDGAADESRSKCELSALPYESSSSARRHLFYMLDYISHARISKNGDKKKIN